MPKPLPAYGFLTALEDADHGFFGGYLVLSDWGRPLEFHCTTPVLPNQAQRILYGATLRPYVLADLIGQTLLAKSTLPVQAVLTDERDMLGLALLTDNRVVCIEDADSANLDGSHPAGFHVGDYRVFGNPTCQWQSDSFQSVLLALASHVDLLEPFQRVRQAISEAQRLTEQTDDDHQDLADAA